ncbi:F-box domain-containing protein [Mycena sanguinolenta]|uniref:F-box domain-containing protein n=1 Tax=Mycena sanguinolenta TaxID=230812 RepID=A0A8H7DHG5_9AGAR|nr:F-box domain-containing protein [Mycena sanguinolenta]
MSQSCGLPCPFRYASEKRIGAVASPFPDLLSTAAGAPSDEEVRKICTQIERAESDISTTNAHISRLQCAMKDLISHRAKLEAFIQSHKAVISAQRRLPNEILLEIFGHCVDPLAPLDPRYNMSWIISQVCSLWRILALNSPQLWRYFILENQRHINDIDEKHCYFRRWSAIQLGRARHIPLFIHLKLERTVDILKLLLESSAQWGEAALSISPEGFTHFFGHGGEFLALKSLTLRSWRPIPRAVHDLRESFPVLEDLRLALSNEALPRSLLLPWAQLRRCALEDVDSIEFSWIASQLSSGAQISVLYGANNDNRSTPQTKTPINSLTLSECGRHFISALLNSLVAPTLETLIIENIATDPLMQHISSFLEQSACALKRLRIDTHIDEGQLVSFLESPHARTIVHLDLPRTIISMRGMETLASHLQLRTLVLRGCSSDLQEPLLAALMKHRLVNRPGFSQELDTLKPEVELVFAP